MKDEEKLMTASSVGGYIPKKCCTWNRYGEPDDESSCPEMCEYSKQDCMNCPIQAAFDRLGDYEQTGLSPDDEGEQREHFYRDCPLPWHEFPENGDMNGGDT